MFQLSDLRPVLAVLASVALLELALGALGPLIGVQLVKAGESAAFIGAISSVYFAGFLIGTLSSHRVIDRVGHIRAFAIFAVVGADAALLHAILGSAWVWMVLRAVTGYAVAGALVVVESWLNDAATPVNRGRIFAAYSVVGWGTSAVGPLGLNLPDAGGVLLFQLATVAMASSLIPIAFSRGGNPELAERRRLGWRQLLRASPLGVFACFASGLMNSTLYGLLPVFTEARGFSAAQLSVLIAAGMVGGLLVQYPVGAAADRFGRRPLMLLVTLTGTALAFAAASTLASAFGPLLVLTFLLASLLAPLYPLGFGQTADYIERRDFVAASGGLLFAWGLGASIGPAVVGQLMRFTGPAGLFLFIGAVLGVTGLFIVVRMLARTALAPAEQGNFVPMPPPEGTPVTLDLDPRAAAAAPPAVADDEPVKR